MRDVIPRRYDEDLRTYPDDDRVNRRTTRDVARAVHREHGRVAVVAARINAAAHVTRTALVNTALLSRDEEQFIQLASLGESRYRAIVDTYAIYAAGEIGEL